MTTRLRGAFRLRSGSDFATVRGLMVIHRIVEPVIPLVFAALISLVVVGITSAQTVGVGAGSYTTALPPGATAPQSTIFKTFAGPVPTHKFWTSKYWNPLGTLSNGGPVYMFPEPLSNHKRAGCGLLRERKQQRVLV